MDAETAARNDLQGALSALSGGDLHGAAAGCDGAGNFIQQQIGTFKSPRAVTDLLARCLAGCLERLPSIQGRKDEAEVREHIATGLLFLGRARQLLGNWAEAIECMQRALTLAALPNDMIGDAYYNISDCYEETRDLESALLFLRKALHVNPDDHDALFNTGMFSGRLGRYEDAVSAFEKCLLLKPTDQTVQRALQRARTDASNAGKNG